MKSIKLTKSLILIAAIVAVLTNFAHSTRTEQAAKDADEQQMAGSSIRTGKLLAIPASLTRFFFYNARPSEHQAPMGTSSVGGYKRSSSALDALTGVTLGKRSAPVDLVNFEPLLGRQYSTIRSPPRMYDMRWAPLDAFDAPVQIDYN